MGSKIRAKILAITLPAIVAAALLMPALLMPALLMPAAWGQTDEPPALSTGLDQQINQQIRELGNLLDGAAQPALAAEPVRLNGRELFRVTATEGVDAEPRAERIETLIQQVARDRLHEASPPVRWQMDTPSRQPVIYLDGKFLMTVTNADAKLYGHTNLELRAAEMTESLRQGLMQFRRERQPQYIRQQLRRTGLLLIAALAASWLLLRMLRRLSRTRRQYLPAKRPINEDGSDPETPLQALAALRRRVFRGERRGFIDLQRWLLYAAQAGIWTGSCFYIVGLFPYTRSLQPIIGDVAKLPVKLVMIAIATYILIRLANLLVDRLLLTVQEEALLQSSQSQRLVLRMVTFSRVVKSVLASLLIGISFVGALSQLGLNLAPLLAGISIVGLALSLASQSLLKDLINGLFILSEDQYGVGDVIKVDAVSGFVENMSLRITQLRNEEGRLITIPNGAISVVENLSKDWSRVDLLIPVSLDADIDQALSLIESVANTLRQSPEWGELILEPPLLLGVDNLDYAGSTVRLWIKTVPLKQWEVAREYRRRLKVAFDKADISIGIPQQSLQIRSNAPGPPPPV
ncbi:MAG: mechanosensitive ion channel family protein [Cyanobacteria bacterium P01_A01_bin.114]